MRLPPCPARRARQTALACVLGLTFWAPAAPALTIVLTPTSPLTALQSSALQAAAQYWEARLTDPVTVFFHVSFGDLGNQVLASTRSDTVTLDYSTVRSALVADATSATDATAVSSLQPGPSLSFIATRPDLGTHLDADGSVNNRYLQVTTANAKALGQSTVNDASSPDAHITFANAYAGSFAYTRVNGHVPAGQTDFITLAQHEMGHALGFVSGVDSIDFCVDHAAQCGTTGGFENAPWYMPLDLYRYSAPGRLDVSVGTTAYFSVDGGQNFIKYFATGEAHGNGAQASHFDVGSGTLMSPYLAPGDSVNASTADLMALDAIGWNLAAPVPEPGRPGLLLAGLGLIGLVLRRRR